MIYNEISPALFELLENGEPQTVTAVWRESVEWNAEAQHDELVCELTVTFVD